MNMFFYIFLHCDFTMPIKLLVILFIIKLYAQKNIFKTILNMLYYFGMFKSLESLSLIKIRRGYFFVIGKGSLVGNYDSNC